MAAGPAEETRHPDDRRPPALIFSVKDVLHHIEDRATYLETLALYLKPGARVAVIDFIPEQSPQKAGPTLVVSEAETTAWMAKAGLKPMQRLDLSTDRYFVIHEK